MSRKGLNTLEIKCQKHCGTITLYQNNGDTYESFKNKLLYYLNSLPNCLHYYFIFHDDDEENLHFHFIIIYTINIRLRTTLNRLSAYLGISTDQIGVEKLTNLNAYLRYFLHLEEEVTKKRYSIDDIFSDEIITRIQDYVDTDSEELSVTRLITLVLTFGNEVDLMNYLGLTLYHKYRYEIKLLYDNMSYLAYHYKHLKPDFKDNSNDLPF